MPSKLDDLDDAVSVAEAARRRKMNPTRLREFIIANGLAIDWPGGGIKVHMSELNAKILQKRVGRETVPSAAAKLPQRRQPPLIQRERNPDVKC